MNCTMKRVLNVAILIALSILSVSCSKKDDTPQLDDRLVGTKWQFENTIAEALYGGTYFHVYEFISATEVERYTTHNGSVNTSDGTFPYTLEYPKITIYAKTNNGNNDTEYFTFTDSRTMVRDGTDGMGLGNKYMRQ